METERGVVRNRQYATQVRDFSGLRFGKITPTDIDGCIEYQDTCYVFIETKYKDAELPYGQRLALQRLCDDLERCKPAIAIIASHETDGDIDVANTRVTEIRFRHEWRHLKTDTTTRALIDRFLAWAKKEKELLDG